MNCTTDGMMMIVKFLCWCTGFVVLCTVILLVANERWRKKQVRAENRKKWSGEPPETPGWYWVQLSMNNDPEIVRLDINERGGLYFTCSDFQSQWHPLDAARWFLHAVEMPPKSSQ